MGTVGYTNAATVVTQLEFLYSHWRGHRNEFWGSSNAFGVATQPPSDDIHYLKSWALSVWLPGFVFPETIMVFSDKQMHILSSEKNVSILEVVKKCAKDAVGVDVVMHVKPKNDDAATQMDAILCAIEAQEKAKGNHVIPVLGYLTSEDPMGKLLWRWTDKIKSSGMHLSDISNGLADLFAVKEDYELTSVRNAAYLTTSAMKWFVVPKMEKVIDEGKKVTHFSLMEYTERVIFKPDNTKL